MTFFHVLLVRYKHPRRYPRFEVYETPLLLASSLDIAEGYIRDYSAPPWYMKDAYVFFIRELPVDIPTLGRECLSERVYDTAGNLIDSRRFSSLLTVPGVFEGRSPDEIRFMPGDIVEVMDKGEVRLAFVADVPVNKERAKEINQDPAFALDMTDDSYMVFSGPNYSSHQHIDALRVFSPHFKVPETIRLRIEKASKIWLRRLSTV